MPNPVTALLARRGLAQPDGRPLCTYLVTDDELDALLSSLRVSPRPAAFVLAGAELWRRNYAGGPWEWSVITTPLRLDLSPRELTTLTVSGLRYWGRDLLRLRRDEYLASIAREAGIPSPVLRAEGKRIRLFFKRLIEGLALYGPSRATVLADLALASLPERLRNPTFRDLAVECAVSARDLALMKVPLADIPGWRSRFPLRLDDEAAQDLVNNLVDRAREAPPQRPLKVLTHLVDTNAGPRLRRVLRMPATLSPDALRDLASLPADELPPRVDLLAIPDGHRPPMLLAHLVRRGDRYAVEVLSDRLPPDRETTLALRAQGQVFGTFRPPGAVLTALPWIFAPDPGDDTLYRLIAQGSARFSAGSHVLLATSAACTLEPSARRRGQLEDRILYQVDVDTRVTGPDFTLRVRVGDEPSDETFWWRGPTLPGDDGIYLGVPDLVVQREDGSIRVVPARLLDISQPALGRTRVRHLVRGEPSFEDQLVIVPRDLELTVKPLADVPDAPRHRVSVGVTSAEQPQLGSPLSVLERTDTTLVIAPPGDRVPATLALHLNWPQHGARVDLRIPYPRTTVTLVHSESDTPLAAGTSLSLDGLHRYRAEGYSSRRHPVFQVEARLEARDVQTSYALLGHLAPQRGPVHALPLYAIASRIERLLSLSMTVDAKVTLRFLDEIGRSAPGVRFSVGRFSAELELDREAKVARVSAPDAELEALDLQTAKSVRGLVADAPGRWSLSPLDDTPTSWMLLARRGNVVIAPPKLHVTRGNPDDGLTPTGRPARSPLQLAIDLPRFEDRRKAIEHRLRELAVLPDDPDWAHLEAFLEYDLPISTFEAVRALIGVPEALGTLLLRSPQPHVLVERFEELPFLWCCLPFAGIVTALKARHRRHESLVTQHPNFAGLLREDHARSIRAFFDALIQRTQGFSVILTALSQSYPELVPAGLADAHQDAAFALNQPEHYVALARELLAAARDELRQRHAESPWPHHESLHALQKRLPALPVPQPDLPDHQRAVAIAPLLAAQCVAVGVLPEPLEAFALRLCQSFDPSYFEETYRLTLPLTLSKCTRGTP